MLKQHFRIILILITLSLGTSRISMAGKVALPTVQQRAWQDLHIGMFIHFAPNTWQDKEYDDLSTPPSEINPAKLDTEQWADTAVKMRAKYIVFVAKHTGGFCMWQTETTDYSLKSSPWRGGKGDVMADLAASCKKRGLGLGIYLSPRDLKLGAGISGICKTDEEQKTYNAIYRQQLTELLTRYGPIVEIWFDGNLVVPVADILRAHAPQAMIFQGPQATIRWVGNEDGWAPYPSWNAVDYRDARTGVATSIHGDPEGDTWLPNEVDVSLRRPSWFWSTTNQNRILALDNLLEIFYRSVGRGTQLLINVSPDRTGSIPMEDVERTQEFGDEIRKRFGKALAETRGTGYRIELKLSKPTQLDHAILMEDIGQGERVREYELEGLRHGRWTALAHGTAIGQIRIQPFSPIEVDAIRLRTTRSSNVPILRRLAVFATNAPPPKSWEAQPKIWSDNQIGSWTHDHFEMDISDKIKASGVYQVRFVPDGGAPIAVFNLEILVGGVPQPQILREVAARKDLFDLTMPVNGQTVTIRGQIRGAEAGIVLLRKK
jgi:alpha-L-fucosidase